jgi:hypothetical protein
MLSFLGPSSRLCDGLTRREWLRAGSLAGLTLPALLQAREGRSAKARARSVIQLFMWGGPSQLETLDLKPDALETTRSLFRPAATSVSGTMICEHLPQLAKLAHRYAIVRSLTHTGVNHGTSAYHMMTGHIHFAPGTLRHPGPTDFPGIGSAVARFGRQPRDLPPAVSLPSIVYDGDGGEVPGQGPGVLGQRFAPFRINGDPTRADFSLDTLQLADDMPERRLTGRIALQAALDRAGERMSKLSQTRDLDTHYDRAFRILQSPAAQRAFRLADEPERMRERYGWHHFGQSCLLARRLVEAGVPLVTVYWNAPTNTDNQSWDTHTETVRRMKDHLLPPLDRALTALLEDLQSRGLLDETLVTWWGEFGRTPKINRQGGRDHWGFCQSAILAGAGVRGGLVHGSSDSTAAYAAENPVSPDDLAATLFDSLGIRLDQEMHDSQGRPYPLCSGKPVGALIS